jgi:hypothetical protein
MIETKRKQSERPKKRKRKRVTNADPALLGGVRNFPTSMAARKPIAT